MVFLLFYFSLSTKNKHLSPLQGGPPAFIYSSTALPSFLMTPRSSKTFDSPSQMDPSGRWDLRHLPLESLTACWGLSFLLSHSCCPSSARWNKKGYYISAAVGCPTPSWKKQDLQATTEGTIGCSAGLRGHQMLPHHIALSGAQPSEGNPQN